MGGGGGEDKDCWSKLIKNVYTYFSVWPKTKEKNSRSNVVFT